MLLKTSELKSTGFIETKNLDGETNLKLKQAHKGISELFNNMEDLENKNLWASYEKPNPYLYSFSGKNY